MLHTYHWKLRFLRIAYLQQVESLVCCRCTSTCAVSRDDHIFISQGKGWEYGMEISNFGASICFCCVHGLLISPARVSHLQGKTSMGKGGHTTLWIISVVCFEENIQLSCILHNVQLLFQQHNRPLPPQHHTEHRAGHCWMKIMWGSQTPKNWGFQSSSNRSKHVGSS